MNINDVLRYGQHTLTATVESVPESAQGLAGACGMWSVKEIVAHLASYELVLVDILSSLSGETTTPHLDRFIALREDFNDAEVDERRTHTMHDVLAELAGAHEVTLRLSSQLAPERARESGTLPWYGEGYSLDDLVVYQYYGHKREHAAQVAVFLDHLAPTEGGTAGMTQ
jgi:hypothetical protein